MPLLPYVICLEPVDDAAIWRHLDLRKFRDLIASEELYFRRADSRAPERRQSAERFVRDIRPIARPPRSL
jgi:hypothetical protein